VTTVVDVATGPSPAEKAATESFTTAARNLQEFGERAGVQRIVVVSIIGIDRFKGGYQAADAGAESPSLPPWPARFRSSPARARRASSRPRGYSFPAAAIACGSRRSAARTSSTQT